MKPLLVKSPIMGNSNHSNNSINFITRTKKKSSNTSWNILSLKSGVFTLYDQKYVDTLRRGTAVISIVALQQECAWLVQGLNVSVNER